MAKVKTLWEDLIGGLVGQEFKKTYRKKDKEIIYDSKALTKFVKNYPYEASLLVESYKSYTSKPHDFLLSAILNKDKKPSNNVYKYILILILCLAVGFTGIGYFSLSRVHPKVLGAKVPVNNLKLATLKNEDYGYTFSYPVNFKVITSATGVELSSTQYSGKIIISINNKIAHFELDPKSSNQEELKRAAKIIQDSIKFN